MEILITSVVVTCFTNTRSDHFIAKWLGDMLTFIEWKNKISILKLMKLSLILKLQVKLKLILTTVSCLMLYLLKWAAPFQLTWPCSPDNVAFYSKSRGRYGKKNFQLPWHTDGLYDSCHLTALESTGTKKVWVTMGKAHDFFKILIVNNKQKIDALVDFEIEIGKRIRERGGGLCTLT